MGQSCPPRSANENYESHLERKLTSMTATVTKSLTSTATARTARTTKQQKIIMTKITIKAAKTKQNKIITPVPVSFFFA